jgi:hypothetical protein
MDEALGSAISAALPPSVELTHLTITEGGWLGLVLRNRGQDSSFTLRLAPERAQHAPLRSSLGGWFSPDAAAGLTVARQLLLTPTWLEQLLSRLPHLALDTRRGVPLGASLSALERLGVWREKETNSVGRATATARSVFELLEGSLPRLVTSARISVEHVRLATHLRGAAIVSVQCRVDGAVMPPLSIGPTALLSRPFAVLAGTAVAIDHGGQLDPDEVPWALAVATSWISALVAAQLSNNLWAWPTSADPLEPPVWPVEAAAPIQRVGIDTPLGVAADELHLELTSECGQACGFCEVRKVLTPTDGGDEALAHAEALVREGRARGCTRLHLGGVDPLSFSRLLPLLSLARDAGYQALTVTTPGRRFSNAEFRHAFRAHAPAAVRAVIPLYGTTAFTHDTIVGVPGAHAEAQAAVEALRAEWGAEGVTLMLVALRENVTELPALVAWSLRCGVPVLAQPVYPMAGARSAAWERSAVRSSSMVAVFAEALQHAVDAPMLRKRLLRVLAQVVPHPCMRKAGLSAADWAFDLAENTDAQPLPGLDSGGLRTRPRRTGSASPVVSCPQAAQCAAAARCPRVLYGAYAASFDVGECSPITEFTS